MLTDYFHLIWEKYRIQIIIGMLVISILVILFLPGIKISSIKQNQNDSSSLISHRDVNYSKQQDDNKVDNEGSVYVDIKGAVHHPGAYQVNGEQRIGNVIQKAGGYTDDADTSQVNLALKVRDQMVVYIPHKGEKIPISNEIMGLNADINSTKTQTGSYSNGKVNLNLATIDQLKGLTGIGEKKAQKIIEYREQHGQFKSVDELKNVNGFGEKSIATLTDQVCV